jgi:hypothetical protein
MHVQLKFICNPVVNELIGTAPLNQDKNIKPQKCGFGLTYII